MPDRGRCRAVEIVDIGPIARRASSPGATGAVAAVFARSFYLTLGGQWTCIVPAGAGAGPLNARCALPEPVDWRRSGLAVGAPVRVAPEAIHVAPGLVFLLARAATWTPGAPGPWSAESLRAGLEALERAMRGRVPQDGLGLLGLSPTRGARLPPVAAAAFGPASALAVRLRAALAPGAGSRARDFSVVRPLLGLGPGLTPSGDDFLGGAMVALRRLGRGDVAGALWRAIRDPASVATCALGRAHLAAAAEGLGGAALHEILDDALAGRGARFLARMAALDAIGHTSGWDALAGVVTVLRAFRGANERASRPRAAQPARP
ncbi:MAG: DUF2877 domain-containing protein [Kiloniellaceae bacterium]